MLHVRVEPHTNFPLKKKKITLSNTITNRSNKAQPNIFIYTKTNIRDIALRHYFVYNVNIWLA